ncbi:MAG: hypothetical protein GF344_15935, partial [Chitinivibrionales bacterium]|nr:hypothetical protein [Chitinivibrionales bacterium]
MTSSFRNIFRAISFESFWSHPKPSILWLLIATAGVLAQRGGDAAGGVIRGVVRDGATGKGLIAAVVNLEKKSFFSSESFVTTTNTRGTYAFTGIKPGKYRMVVEVTGYNSFVREDIRLVPAETLVLNIPLTPAPRTTIAGCDTCSHSGLVLGKVTDANTGAPLSGARVTLSDHEGREITGDDGLFSFTEVAGGIHRL